MRADIVLVGAGLANGLIAWRLREQRPDLSVLMLERDDEAGGNHTWSFHSGDVSAEQMRWLEPFVVHQWAGQTVHFPHMSRDLRAGYCAITSDRFAALIRRRMEGALMTSSPVRHLGQDHVVLADGARIDAGVVIDGRGEAPSGAAMFGYQKFLGLELAFDAPHGLKNPIIMDARVSQTDGYRFVYVLPFAPDRALIEDTYYSDDASLDRDQLRTRVLAYADEQGWTAPRILREEAGVLPILLAGKVDDFFGSDGVVRSGLSAGLCHPVTGYSLPDAARLADFIASRPDLSSAALGADVRAYARRRWRNQSFLRLLSRLLFLAAKPEQRRRVMERFYGLSEPLISRFYAGAPTLRDKARTLSGRPPVPIARALPLVFEQRVLRRAGARS